MRFAIPVVVSAFVLAFSAAAQAATLESNGQSFDKQSPLDDILDPFGFDQDKTVYDICYQGDRNKVCSLLAKMSDLSGDRYSEGAHGLADLKGCRIQGRGSKPVIATIELINDYEDGSRTITAVIEACGN